MLYSRKQIKNNKQTNARIFAKAEQAEQKTGQHVWLACLSRVRAFDRPASPDMGEGGFFVIFTRRFGVKQQKELISMEMFAAIGLSLYVQWRREHVFDAA